MERWQSQFIKMLFHYDARRLNIERAYRLKHPNVPTSLYKYRSFCDTHKSAFLTGELWTSSADRLNDPYEWGAFFRPDAMIVEDLSRNELDARIADLQNNRTTAKNYLDADIQNPTTSKQFMSKIMDGALKDHPHEKEMRMVFQQVEKSFNEDLMNEMSDAMRQHVSVLSLSATYESTLMWSHYSNSHTGFVIKYDFGALEYSDLRRRLCCPVFYSTKQRDITYHLIKRPGSPKFNNLFGSYIALVKQAEWAYEKEWRIVNMIGSDYATRPMQMPHPKSVILGKNCSDEDQEWMEQTCSDMGIDLHKMKPADRHGCSELENILTTT